jgi:hypothetical protein
LVISSFARPSEAYQDSPRTGASEHVELTLQAVSTDPRWDEDTTVRRDDRADGRCSENGRRLVNLSVRGVIG